MEHLREIPLPAPITIRTPLSPRPRGGVPGPTREVEFDKLFAWFRLDTLRQQVWVQFAAISNPMLVWGPEDFPTVASDLPEHHVERVMQILGSDPAAALQALCNGQPLPPPPQRVPREIANWRARAVLELAGLLPAVEAAIEAMAGEAGIVVRNAWQSGAPLARRGPTVSAIAPALGLTEAQVDSMFIQAAALEV